MSESVNPPLGAAEVGGGATSTWGGGEPQEARVLRLEFLLRLEEAICGADSAVAVCEAAAEALAGCPGEVAFAVFYLVDGDEARRVADAGLDGGSTWRGEARLTLRPAAGAAATTVWPVAAIVGDALPRVIALHPGADDPSLREALAQPLVAPGDAAPIGVMIIGAPPTRRLAVDARGFHARVAAMIARALDRVRVDEARAREADARATQIFESAPDGVHVFDAAWRLRWMNQAARGIMRAANLDPGALLGKHLWDEIAGPGPHEGPIAAQVRRVMDERTPAAFESFFEGWGRWLAVRVFPLPDGGVVFYFQDISERKEAEAAQRATEARIAAELRAMTDLHALSTRLARASDLEASLAEILDAALSLHRTRMGAVQLFEPRTRTLRLVAARGLPASFSERFRRISIDEPSCCERALTSRARVLVDDFESDPESAAQAELAASLGVRAAEIVPLVDRRGEPLGMIAIYFAAPHRPGERELRMMDLYALEAAQLTERLRGDEAMRASEARYRTFFENIHESVSIAEAVRDEGGEVVDFIFRDVNEASLRVMGLRREQFVGHRASELPVLPPEARSWLARLYGAVLSSGEPLQYEGGLAGAYFVSTLFRMGDDLIASAAIDITARKRAEERLRESELRLRAIADLVPDLLWSNDGRGVTDWYNQRWSEYTGQSFDEACEFGWLAAVHPGDRDASLAAFMRAIETGAPLRMEHRILGVDGEYRWFLVQARPLRGPSGEIQRWFGAATDIDEMQRAQEVLRRSHEELEEKVRARTRALLESNAKLRRSEERFARAFHASPIPTLLSACEDGRVLDVNESGLRFFSADRDAIIGRTAQELGAWSEVGGEVQDAEPGAREVRELRFHHRSGAVRHVLRSQEAVTLDGVPCLIVMMVDITERKQAEQERAALLERIYTVQEDERRRIARELHDQLGQEITALILGLRRLGLAAAEGEALGAEIDGLQAIAHQLGHDAHTLALRLRPTALDDLGLVAALEHHLEQWGQNARVEVDFQTSGLEGQQRLPPAIETTIYRVVQESLTNVMRHAEAKSVAVVVERRSDHVLAIVEDDGRGFDTAAANKRGNQRLGLVGLRERAVQAGGSVSIESSPGGGTTVFLRIPLKERGGDEA